MAISFNVGTSATGEGAHTVPFTFTIPAGVAAGDVMIVALDCQTTTSASPAIATPASGGGSWSPIPPGIVDSGPTSGYSNYATGWCRVATASDPGSTFSVTFTGSIGSIDRFGWAAAFGSYTGANTSTPIDVSGGNGIVGSSVTCPTKTTGAAGDWALYLGPISSFSAYTIAGPAGTTQRANITGSFSPVFPGSALFDSNGSVGGAGTSIGGGVFTPSQASWCGALTVGLAPAGGGSPPSGSVQPRATIPVPRRSPARSAWRGVTPLTVNAAGPAGNKPGGWKTARRPARAFWGGILAAPPPLPSGTMQPRTTLPAARRYPARVIWRGTISRTTNTLPVAALAPQQLITIPRRATARVYWRGTITSTTNATIPPGVVLGVAGTRWRWTAGGARNQ